jgi:hypothetical protein
MAKLLPHSPTLVSLTDLADIISGLTPAKREEGTADSIQVIQVGDLIEATDEVRPITALNWATVIPGTSIDRSKVQTGDVLVSCKGTIGRLGLVGPETQDAVATSNLLIARPKEGVKPTTLLAILKSERAQQFFQSRARGGAIQSLSFRDLEALEVPPIEALPQNQLKELLLSHAASVKATGEAVKARGKLTSTLLEQTIWG